MYNVWDQFCTMVSCIKIHFHFTLISCPQAFYFVTALIRHGVLYNKLKKVT